MAKNNFYTIMNICIFVGARPNFIKVAPILRAMDAAGVDHSLVYAGREDDPTLEASLFDDLQMSRPDVYLGVDCENLNELTGQVMSAFERYLQENKTDTVIVVDDLASTMAAAIVTKKQGIRLAHLVAGTRSFDINMPKEINRLVIDGLSDILFTAGIGGSSAATREGAESSKIYQVGNILMDTLRFNHQRFVRPAVMDELQLTENNYIVFTLNRKALIVQTDELRSLLLSMMSHAGDIPVVAPLRKLAAEAVQKIVNENPLLLTDYTSLVRSAILSSAISQPMLLALLPIRATWLKRQRSIPCLASRLTAIPSISRQLRRALMCL